MSWYDDILGLPFVGVDLLPRWEACAFPERQPDCLTEFIMGCEGCRIALEAAISVPPSEGQFTGFYDSAEQIREMLKEKGWEDDPKST